jgi:ribosomal protein S18 acetylase RimI-like enzyme
MPTVHPLPPERVDDAVSVLCDAFREYPVMRYILGTTAGGEDHLRTLIRFFVMARVWRGEPMLAVTHGDTVAGVAVMTPPGEREPSPEMAAAREAVWKELGAEARTRYEYLGTVWQDFAIGEPHLHLNMIGVRRAHAGQGLGRRLLDAVHRLSEDDPGSGGVSLTTENPVNVALYKHFGYKVTGHRKAAPDLETWGFYRPNPAP